MKLTLGMLVLALCAAACGTSPAVAYGPTRSASATVAPSVPAPTAAPQPSPTGTSTALPAPSATPPSTPTLTPAEAVAAGPTPDAGAHARKVRLPILMYHYVEPWPGDASDLRRGLTVRPEDFAAQMQYLADHGYVTVSLYDLSAAITTGQPLPERAVVLTFDDGYRTLMDYALPILQAHAFSGTVFAITEFMDRGFPAYLTWDQARTLYSLGWRIEPHTKTHTELAGQSWDKQLYEILGSVETIQANLGVRPRFLCYPSGKYDETSVKVADQVQLWGAVTTHFGRLHGYADRFMWTRVRVDGRATLHDFISGLEGDTE